MKKIVYAVIIAFTASLAVTACTEEQVVPVRGDNGGTYPSDPVK